MVFTGGGGEKGKKVRTVKLLIRSPREAGSRGSPSCGVRRDEQGRSLSLQWSKGDSLASAWKHSRQTFAICSEWQTTERFLLNDRGSSYEAPMLRMPITGTSCASVVEDVQCADGASRLPRANVTAAGRHQSITTSRAMGSVHRNLSHRPAPGFPFRCSPSVTSSSLDS